MKNLLPLLFLCYLLSSCATILNGSKTKVNVYTPTPTTVVTEDGTYTTNKNNKAVIRLKRSKKDVEILVDGHTAMLDSKLSTAFILGLSNIFSGYGLLGVLVDMTNQKRFTYKRVLYMHPTDSVPMFLNYRPQNRKGEINISFSAPYSLTQYHIHPPNEIRPLESVGIWAYKMGIDYYHTPKQYLSLSTRLGSNIVLFRRPEEVGGIHFSLSNNHKIKRLTVGYGINYAYNVMDVWNENAPFIPNLNPRRAETQNLGLVLSTHYQTGGYFYMGIDYRPTFIRIGGGLPAQYEHTIALDLVWKIE